MTGSIELLDDLVPVILAGGSGTRLWPLSRAAYPKHLVNLTGGGSLLQQTARRLIDPLPDTAQLITIAAARQADLVRRQLRELDPVFGEHLVLEPAPRNTAAAVALAALYTSEKFDGASLMWICPSDHLIQAPQHLYDAVRKGAVAARNGALVTFGITPSRPDPGFGYIARGAEIGDIEGVFKADRFVEKPPREQAQAMLDNGGYSWNSGIFLMRADTLLEQLGKFEPGLLSDTRAAFANAETATSGRIDLQKFSAVKSMPIDKAVMERSDRVVVVPCDPKWSDLGSWHALWEISVKDEDGNSSIGDVVTVETRDTIVRADHRLVATAGVSGLAIIETPDAIIVADRQRSELVKEIVSSLDAKQRKEAEHHLREIKPWGEVRLIEQHNGLSIREILIDPNSQIPEQSRSAASRTITVVEGIARIEGDNGPNDVATGESLSMAAGSSCQIKNREDLPLRLIEVTINTPEISA